MNRRKLAFVAVGGIAAAALAFALQPDDAPAAKADAAQHDEAAAPEGFVAVSDAQIAASQIGTARVAPGSAVELVFPATVATRPTGTARIDARAPGVVLAIGKSLGDHVRRGEAIARIESAEAAGLASQASIAQARVNELSAAYERERRLFEAKVTARQDWEAAQANLAVARSELQRARAAASAAGVGGDGRSLAVISPISGRIAAAPAVLGSFVNAGQELFRVVDPSAIQVEVAIPIGDSAAIAPGDPVSLALPGGGAIAGKVRSLTPALDPETRTATAVVSVDGGAEGLQPGSFLDARIRPSGKTDPGRIAVPEEAVQTVEGREVVFRRVKGGFQAVPVTTGERSGGMVVLLSGIAPGITIATGNAFLLKAELGKEGAEHGH